jgi:hypothetical protein
VRAFANGSSSGSTFGVGRLVGLFALAIVATLAITTSASAASPTVTIGAVTAVTGDGAHVTGTVDPADQTTYYAFETSTDGVTWPEFFSAAEGPLAPGAGVTPVEKDLSGLHGGTEYFVRLATFSFPEEQEVVSPGPNPTFTSLAVAAPSVLSVDNASSVAYTTADASGEVERPAGAESAFDVNCRFEVISDAQFVENEANSAPGFANAAQVPCNVDPLTVAGPTPVTAELTGLAVGTTYHLRLVGENAGGTDSKAANNFTTLTPAPPVVSIAAPGGVSGTTAHFSGTVNPGGTDPVFATTWEFICQPGCPGAGSSGAISPPDASPHTVEFNPTGLEPNTAYTVKLVATNAVGESTESAIEPFHTTVVGPGVETLPAFALGDGTEALVGGNVNPKNSATVYWVEYGTTQSYGQSSPPTKDAPAGSGGADQTLTQRITGLTPGTTYHFQLVAKNGGGEESRGVDMTFEATPPSPAADICPNALLRSENNSTALPECRSYEQVSPTDKNGYDASTSIAFSPFVAAEDGSALSFESYGTFANPASGPTINLYLSKRGGTGWTTQALSPPVSPAPNSDFPTFNYFTPDLGFAVVRTPASAPLSPGATPGAMNLYLRDNKSNTYTTLDVNTGTENPPGPNSTFIFQGASANAEHVTFLSDASLTPNALVGSPNLYDWSNGQLELTGIEPGSETPLPGGVGRIPETDVATHVISEDGSRIVFQGDLEGQLYLRENAQSTVEISQPAGGVAKFWGASADTSKIFFTTNVNSGLYRYDVDTHSRSLIASNAGGVVALSEDGSSVYFAATGQLVPGQGNPQDSNLYLWQEDPSSHQSTISFVARDSGTAAANATTYRLSANGRYLTFATPARLTSFDNTDAVTGQPDNEVYVYDAILKRLTCVSCDSDGQTPTAQSGFPAPPIRPQRNLQPGASDKGVVYFNSSEALVPADVNSQEDVYEWKQGRVYLVSSGRSSDPSFYASAGSNGRDVFFATREQLVPSDKDQDIDVYDAREEGGFRQPVLSRPCEEAETCRGAASVAPALAEPTTGSPSHIGQASAGALRREAELRRKRKTALKACTRKPKKAKAKCRTNVKKRFKKAGRAH